VERDITDLSDICLDVVSGSLTKQWEASGLDGLIDKPRSGRTPVLDESDHQRLQELVAEQPHQIRSLQARFEEETGKTVSTVTLRRALKKKALRRWVWNSSLELGQDMTSTWTGGRT